MVAGRLLVVVIANKDNKSKRQYYKLRHGRLIRTVPGSMGNLSTESPTIVPRATTAQAIIGR